MAWPQLDDFRYAIQDPASCFSDPELQTAEVVCDMLGMPKMASGNFACCYELRNGSKSWAVRTFNHEVTDQQLRYQLVSDHLGAVGIPYIVRFQYQPRGILVNGEWYPIVKMSWVRGITLNRWVRENRDQPETVRDFAKDWRGMIGALYGLKMAHADLQQGNVLVTESNEVKLVDYDGMFVPAMQGKPAPELGHPNWNHPKRDRKAFGPYLDQFPGLVGYLSLLAVATEPALLDEYCNDENIILSQTDMAAPTSSPVLSDLQSIKDNGIDELTEALIRWCEQSVDYDTLENIATGGASPPVGHVFSQPASGVGTMPVPAPKTTIAVPKKALAAAAAVVIAAAAGWLTFSMGGGEQPVSQTAAPVSEQPAETADERMTSLPPQEPPVTEQTPVVSQAEPPPQEPPPQEPPSAAKTVTSTIQRRPAESRTPARRQTPPAPAPVPTRSPEPAVSPTRDFEFQNPARYYQRAMQRVEQNNFVGAESDLSKAIVLTPDDPTYYRERGIVRQSLGDMIGARLDYDKAISLDPRFSAAYNSRGVLRRAQGDLAGARADYDRAIAMNPLESKYFRNRGNLRLEQGDLIGAREDYEQAIALSPDDGIAYNSRGVVREQLGDYPGALEDYNKAIELNPNVSAFYQNRSKLRRIMGDVAGAQADLDKSLQLRSRN